jgi:hypothetical protein
MARMNSTRRALKTDSDETGPSSINPVLRRGRFFLFLVAFQRLFFELVAPQLIPNGRDMIRP